MMIEKMAASGVSVMKVKFQSKTLQILYTEEKNAQNYPASIVDNFFEVMTVLRALPNEQEIYRCKSVRLEKLQSDRGKQQQYCIWLDRKWGLIIALDEDADGEFLLVIDIQNYYRKAT
jgi:plasmid maintenance system killer protein